MSVWVYIASSLDGYIADSRGGIDWLTAYDPPQGEDYGFSEFMARIDAVVMGRKTFEQVLSFNSWPYTKPVFVLSSSLKTVPHGLSGKCRLISGSPRQVIDELSRMDFQHLYVDGGLTVQGFLESDLVDELIITRVPLLLGGGIPLFGRLSGPLRFEFMKTDAYPNGLQKTWYRRAR
jgi:dihydrofolate reductase